LGGEGERPDRRRARRGPPAAPEILARWLQGERQGMAKGRRNCGACHRRESSMRPVTIRSDILNLLIFV